MVIASGLAVGCIVGLTGVGGGSLTTPLPIGAFRLPPTGAVGTDLWVAAITKSGGTVARHRLGAGAIGAALIVLLCPRLGTARTVGTDNAYALLLTLVAGIGHASLGHVDWALLASLLMGSLPGIWLGARLASSLPERVLRAALCASLVHAGVKTIG